MKPKEKVLVKKKICGCGQAAEIKEENSQLLLNPIYVGNLGITYVLVVS